MRTQQEIVDRIEAVKNEDFFGAETGDLLNALDFEHAKPYLKPGVTPEQWVDAASQTAEKVIEDMRNYMGFAWGKALDQRGLSASRSISHFRAWLWLLEDEELLAFINGDNYAQYGKPILRAICEKYGFDVPYADKVRDYQEEGYEDDE